MKQGRTLPNLAEELERQANAKRDFVVSATNLRVHTNGTSALQFVQNDETYPLNEIAHGQLAEYAGVPKLFYDRLRCSAMTLRVPVWPHVNPDDPATWPANVEGDEPLFDLVVNRLLRDKGADTRLVRTLDSKARAFLSSSFDSDLDNWDVFRVAAKVLTESGLTADNVVSTEVTERKLYIKVVTPRLQAVIQPSNLHREHGGHHYLKEPQVIQAGFILTNSETGLGALKVETVVMKLQCTNLWVTETSYRKRHLGKVLEADEGGVVYKSDTRMADAHARLLKLRDHVADALDEQRFLALVAKIQQSAEIPLGTSLEHTVDATARKFNLSQAEKDSVIRNLIEGADLTLWGLTNAITQTAQSVASYDRATELETIGGRFFNLPQHEVRELIAA